jgi:hypothetical protein
METWMQLPDLVQIELDGHVLQLGPLDTDSGPRAQHRYIPVRLDIRIMRKKLG